MTIVTNIRPVAYRPKNADAHDCDRYGLTQAPVLHRSRNAVAIDKVGNIERIQEGLKNSGYMGLRGIECDSVQNCFVLRGSVSSFYLKQVAQTLAGSVVGLGKIKNRIQVHRKTRTINAR